MKKKITYNFVKKSFEEENYTLISTNYIDANSPLEFICPNGHKYKIRWKNWNSGQRCGKCYKENHALSYDYVKSSIEAENYIMLSTSYNYNTKLHLICPEGHEYHTSWNNWQQGKRCGICDGQVISYEGIKKTFKSEDYILLSTKYKNCNDPLKFICPNGHQHEITWRSWQQGHRCGYCSNLYNINIDIVRNNFEKEGFKLLSDIYKNALQKIKFICSNGHQHEITWRSWQQGQRCKYCNGKEFYDLESILIAEGYTILEILRNNDNRIYYKLECPQGHITTMLRSNLVKNRRCKFCTGNIKKEHEEIYLSFKKENYLLLSTTYNNAHDLLYFKCPEGHDHQITWNSWQQGIRCGKCSNLSSVAEQEISNILLNQQIKIYTNYRKIINPLELDIVIPYQKIAIEYCGLYWHSELQGKDRNYHINKLKLCNEKGYRLITIFEDEWLNYKDVIINKILSIVHSNKNSRIHARNCEIRENDNINDFLDLYHLQGKGSSSIKLGAFHKEELVAVMTFSRPSIAKGARNQDFWEINRFCTHKDYHIPGIASKLLVYFERNYEWIKIISYADRRWSEGNLYYKLGFNLVGETKPNYWYLDKNYKKRIHRFALRKKPEEPKGKTEWELRQEQGYDRIWDCGSLKFKKLQAQ